METAFKLAVILGFVEYLKAFSKHYARILGSYVFAYVIKRVMATVDGDSGRANLLSIGGYALTVGYVADLVKAMQNLKSALPEELTDEQATEIYKKIIDGFTNGTESKGITGEW